MKTSEEKRCCCAMESCATLDEPRPDGSKSQVPRYVLIGVPLLAVWFVIYKSLAPFSKFFTYALLGLSSESHLGHAIEFFVYDTPKVLMLLTLVVFGVGIVRSLDRKSVV